MLALQTDTAFKGLFVFSLLRRRACLFFLAMFCVAAAAQTNDPAGPPLPVNDTNYVDGFNVPLPPTGSPPAPKRPYYVENGVTNYLETSPFLLVKGITEDGRPVFEAPPEWMIAAERPEAFYEVTAWNELTEEPIVIRIYPQGGAGFFQGGMKVER